MTNNKCEKCIFKDDCDGGLFLASDKNMENCLVSLYNKPNQLTIIQD
jgi:hypothetical protein